jgi:Rrf2 family protein
MRLLSGQFIFTLRVVLDIAINGEDAPVESKKVVGRNGINARYLEPVLQALVRNNILRGVRGPKGGYQLARPRHAITLADIEEVVSGTRQKDTGPQDESDIRRLVVGPLAAELAERWSRDLAEITLEDLYEKAVKISLTPTQDDVTHKSGQRTGSGSHLGA